MVLYSVYRPLRFLVIYLGIGKGLLYLQELYCFNTAIRLMKYMSLLLNLYSCYKKYIVTAISTELEP